MRGLRIQGLRLRVPGSIDIRFKCPIEFWLRNVPPVVEYRGTGRLLGPGHWQLRVAVTHGGDSASRRAAMIHAEGFSYWAIPCWGSAGGLVAERVADKHLQLPKPLLSVHG